MKSLRIMSMFVLGFLIAGCSSEYNEAHNELVDSKEVLEEEYEELIGLIVEMSRNIFRKSFGLLHTE